MTRRHNERSVAIFYDAHRFKVVQKGINDLVQNRSVSPSGSVANRPYLGTVVPHGTWALVTQQARPKCLGFVGTSHSRRVATSAPRYATVEDDLLCKNGVKETRHKEPSRVISAAMQFDTPCGAEMCYVQ